MSFPLGPGPSGHFRRCSRGAEHARLNLLSPSIGWFERLCRDYALPAIRFPPEHILVIPGADGRPLEDIRTPADNVCAADFITEQVRRFTADDDGALHVSIAGGRKTMGYFVGYALSLFGRPQDRLSHVLVTAPYESHRDFYYPSPTERHIHVSQGGKDLAYDCRAAQVDLAWIPFVRLASAQHQPLIAGRARFSDCVNAVQEALAERELVIDLQTRTIRLPPSELAFLSWFARRAKAGLPPLPRIPIPEEDTEQRGLRYRTPFVEELKRIDPLLDEGGKTMKAISYRLSPDYFNTKNSKLNKALKDKLGALAARPYLVLQEGEGAGYALALPPAAIRYGHVPAPAKGQRPPASATAGIGLVQEDRHPADAMAWLTQPQRLGTPTP